jgi:hypothetical protein
VKATLFSFQPADLVFSPPTAAELIRRQGKNPNKLEEQLVQWEEWAAELLESHLAYRNISFLSKRPRRTRSMRLEVTTIRSEGPR